MEQRLGGPRDLPLLWAAGADQPTGAGVAEMTLRGAYPESPGRMDSWSDDFDSQARPLGSVELEGSLMTIEL